MGTGLGGCDERLRVQRLQHQCTGLASVTDGVFLCFDQFSGALFQVRYPEQRIITKATIPLGFRQNFPLPSACCDQRCWVLGRSQKNHAAKKISASIGMRSQLTEQARVVVGVSRLLSSVACAENARRSAQGSNDQSAVVSDAGQPGSGGYGSGFD